jgi:hypothetical protein
MRIHEENCNLVLLAGVTLLSATVATAAALLEPASVATSTSTVETSLNDKPPVRLADQVPVRVIGAPFVPNINPRER